MVHAMRDRFTQIYTIELDRALYERASQRFAANAHIHVIHGDGAEELPKVLDRVSEPCLFWLDAHYSAGITAHGPLETPIIKELTAVLRHRQSHHVILIDDARNFNGSRDYPTLTWLQDFVKSERPNYVLRGVGRPNPNPSVRRLTVGELRLGEAIVDLGRNGITCGSSGLLPC
jgi:hypothetical protein